MTLPGQSDTRPCASCGRELARTRRQRYCSPVCRAEDLRAGPRRFAYADPPYPNTAHLYRDHPDFAGEVDHAELVERLVAEFPDGWALSTSAQALPDVLPLCPRGIRVMVWTKPFTPMKPSASVQYAWEPVLVHGGRPRSIEDGLVRDVVSANPVAYRAVDGGVIGMKPPAFCRWLFQVLGAGPDDELVDLFPGSGAVDRAWRAFCAQPPLTYRAIAPQDPIPTLLAKTAGI
jgi:hypothetical protein